MWRRATIISLALFSVCYFLNLLTALHFVDYDLFARLAVGRLIFMQGEVPLQDVFSFSETKPVWYDHEWLAGLSFYAILQDFGELGLFSLSILAAVATFVFLYLAQQKQENSPKLGIILLFVVAILSVGMWAAVVRAQIVSFFFFALEIWLLTSFRISAKRRYIVVLPLIFLLWANSHGGFIVGAGFLAISVLIALIEKREGRVSLLIAAVVAAITPSINPYGLGYLYFLFNAIGKDRPLIDEWTPLPLNPLEMIAKGHSGFLLFAALVLVGVCLHWRKIPKEGSVFCLFALFYGVSHQRLLPFFYCSAAVFFLPTITAIGAHIAESKKEAVSRVTEVLSLCAGAWALWLGIQLYSNIDSFKINISPYPVAAMNWLSCQYSGGRILSSFNSGSFVLWRGYPNFLVAVDGRYEEVYEDEIVKQVQISLSRIHPGRDAALAEINPDFVLRCGVENERELPSEWLEVYRDDKCSVAAKQAVEEEEDCSESSVWIPNF